MDRPDKETTRRHYREDEAIRKLSRHKLLYISEKDNVIAYVKGGVDLSLRDCGMIAFLQAEGYIVTPCMSSEHLSLFRKADEA